MTSENPMNCSRASEADLAQRYLLGRLSDAERDRFEEHMFACDDCLRQVETLDAARAALPKRVRPVRAAPWRTIAVAAGLVLALLVGWQLGRREPSLSTTVVRAANARVIEPQLFEEQRWAAFESEPSRRGGAAERLSLQSTELAGDTPLSLHEAAARVMVAATPEAVDAVILRLDRGEPQVDTRVLLSAAWIVRFDRGGAPRDLEQAVEQAQRALNDDPSRLDAAFNKALALEKLGSRLEADAAWQSYLSLDPPTDWAEEAERRRAALGAAGPSSDGDDPEVAREKFWSRLSDAWSTAMIDGKTAEASAYLEEIASLARFLEVETGNTLPGAIVDELRDARPSDAKAIALFASGRAALDRGKIFDALEQFDSTAIRLPTTSPSLELWVEHYRALATYYSGDPAAALRRIDRLERLQTERATGAAALEAENFWLRGLIQTEQASFADAIRSFRRAAELFDRMGEESNAGYTQLLESQALDLVGDYPRADERRRRIVAQMTERESPTRRSTVLLGIAHARLQRALPAAALSTLELAAETARELPVHHAAARFWSAHAWLSLGRTVEARDQLQLARDVLGHAPRSNWSERIEAELALVRARLFADAGEFDRSLVELGQARRYYDRAGLRFTRPAIALELGRVLVGRDSLAEAREAFADGLSDVETDLAALTTPLERIAYLDRFDALVDETLAVELQLEATPIALLDLLLQARGRQRAGEATDVERIMPRLGSETLLAVFHALADRLLIWSVTDTDVRLESVDVARRELRDRLGAYRHALQMGQRTSAPDEAWLYDALIAPIERSLEGRGELIVVPDGRLSDFPFAALRRPSGRFLVEEFSVIVSAAPRLPAMVPTDLSGSQRTLFVGDPSFDRETWSSLPRLPGAAAEVTRAAALYERSELRTGADATRAAVLSGVHFDLLHFAGHTLADPWFPERSRMIVADGELLAGELSRGSLAGLHLVVLSSCRSATGRRSLSEGQLGLARYFLDGGVSAVAASLWDLSDREPAELWLDFHRELLGGASPALALSRAQTRAIQRNESSSIWAAFQLFV